MILFVEERLLLLLDPSHAHAAAADARRELQGQLEELVEVRGEDSCSAAVVEGLEQGPRHGGAVPTRRAAAELVHHHQAVARRVAEQRPHLVRLESPRALQKEKSNECTKMKKMK